MMRLSIAPLGVAAALLAGCAASPDAQNPPETLPATQAPQAGARVVACSPRAWQQLVGTQLAQARLPAGLEYRVMTRGTMILDEYSENRLNIITDTRGRIVEVTCG